MALLCLSGVTLLGLVRHYNVQVPHIQLQTYQFDHLAVGKPSVNQAPPGGAARTSIQPPCSSVEDAFAPLGRYAWPGIQQTDANPAGT